MQKTTIEIVPDSPYTSSEVKMSLTEGMDLTIRVLPTDTADVLGQREYIVNQKENDLYDREFDLQKGVSKLRAETEVLERSLDENRKLKAELSTRILDESKEGNLAIVIAAILRGDGGPTWGGEGIHVIKLVRRVTTMGLKEAVDFVNSIKPLDAKPLDAKPLAAKPLAESR